MENASERRDNFLSWVKPVFRAINQALKEKSVPPARRGIAIRIATKLGLIESILASTPFYRIGPEVDQLCQTLSDNFAFMDTWVQRCSNVPIRIGAIRCFQMIFPKQAPTDDQLKETCSLAFFNAEETEHYIHTIYHNCCRLHDLIDDGNDGDGSSVPASFKRDSKDYLINLGRDLFDALELHIKCNPNEPYSQRDHQSQAWHPTRLCLVEEKHEFPAISLLISPMPMDHWQDVHLMIEPEVSNVIDDNTSAQPAFCNLADTQQYMNDCIEIGFDRFRGQFQLHQSKKPLESEPGPGCGKTLSWVLREFNLKPEDRVVLAYTIAQAYHHFYDSDLMRIKWTSEVISFMPPATKNEEMQLRPYLIFPFGTRNDPVADFVDEIRLVHCHPRILTVGILLLEIALSKPFQPIQQRNIISQANCDHKIANNLLKDLKKIEWDGFEYKCILDETIEYCIRTCQLPVGKEKQLGPVGTATGASSKLLSDKQPTILRQRQEFYKHVVYPLKYLAERGFKHEIGNTLCIRKKPEADPLNAELPNELPLLESLFHTGKIVMPEKWLNDLNSIGMIIARQQRIHKVERAIRVAILDTGIYLDDDDSMLPRIKETRDFVDNSSTKKTDTFGHGSLMAKLVMNCAPSAEIIIARVARDTKGLDGSQGKIEDAIMWAGLKCQADIISMSFGFSRDHEGISTAINTVQSKRNGSVIFLASAGNSSFESETFPARHSSVISIHAANCHGTFLETNPRLPDGAPAIWGTYGSDIPKKTH